jgi:serine/threonine protein kinase
MKSHNDLTVPELETRTSSASKKSVTTPLQFSPSKTSQLGNAFFLSDFTRSQLLDRVKSDSIGQGLEPSLDFYVIGQPIGRGSYSKVYDGFHKVTETKVAAKVFKRSVKPDRIEKETKLMSVCKHPYVLPVYECIATDQFTVLMLGMCSGGNLLRHVRLEDGLDEHDAKPLFRQLVTAV